MASIKDLSPEKRTEYLVRVAEVLFEYEFVRGDTTVSYHEVCKYVVVPRAAWIAIRKLQDEYLGEE